MTARRTFLQKLLSKKVSWDIGVTMSLYLLKLPREGMTVLQSTTSGEGRRMASLGCFPAAVGRLHQRGTSSVQFAIVLSSPVSYNLTWAGGMSCQTTKSVWQGSRGTSGLQKISWFVWSARCGLGFAICITYNSPVIQMISDSSLGGRQCLLHRWEGWKQSGQWFQP